MGFRACQPAWLLSPPLVHYYLQAWEGPGMKALTMLLSERGQGWPVSTEDPHLPGLHEEKPTGCKAPNRSLEAGPLAPGMGIWQVKQGAWPLSGLLEAGWAHGWARPQIEVVTAACLWQDSLHFPGGR